MIAMGIAALNPSYGLVVGDIGQQQQERSGGTIASRSRSSVSDAAQRAAQG
jgi:hypothetical protein